MLEWDWYGTQPKSPFQKKHSLPYLGLMLLGAALFLGLGIIVSFLITGDWRQFPGYGILVALSVVIPYFLIVMSLFSFSKQKKHLSLMIPPNAERLPIWRIMLLSRYALIWYVFGGAIMILSFWLFNLPTTVE